MSGRRTYRVTVVTVVLNQAEQLRHAVHSVAEQDYSNMEYIVIDGGSSDGTLEVIRDNASVIDHWISERDSGIADAMNKGLAKATGDLILFLHSDDRFVDSGALSGAMRHVVDSDHIWAFDVVLGERAARRVAPRPFNLWARFRNPLCHQGVLCPRRLFEEVGGFDVRWKISMDYELWLRAIRRGVPLVRISRLLSIMGDGGVSSRTDWNGLRPRLEEERAIQAVHADSPGLRLGHAAFWPLYMTYRRTRALLASQG